MSMNNVNSYNANNYCACTGGTPEYVIKLNQQGPPGPQGEQGLQGPQGVSPEVSVYQDTDDTYILQVITATSSFMTPNLMAQADDLVNNLDQKLQAEIDTKANLTLDNINVADPFTLNGLVIDNSSDEALELRPNTPGRDFNLTTGGDTTLQGNVVLIQDDSKANILRISSSGATYNNEQLATQPWVEEQLEDVSQYLSQATATQLGLVKAETIYLNNNNRGQFPYVVIDNATGTTQGRLYLQTEGFTIPQSVIIDTSSGGMTTRQIKSYWLTGNDTVDDVTLRFAVQIENQMYYALTGGWITTGSHVITSPSVATTSRLGFVKPDGTTITITDDGTISAVGGGGGGNIINDDVPSDATTYSSNKIDELNGQQNGQITQLVDTVTNLQNLVTSLQSRVAALEANINGGNA